MRQRGGDIAQATPAQRERRYIFNGERQNAPVAGYDVRPNRRPARRRVSPFNAVLTLFGLGILIVLYINNIIVVNSLAAEVAALQGRLEKIGNTNAALTAEVSRKSSLERVGAIGVEQLSLQYAHEKPVWFETDEGARDRAREAEEAERLRVEERRRQ